MGDLSFDIKTPYDFFEKLKEEFSDLEQNPLSSRYAINCAMNAWHLVDWVYWNYFKLEYPRVGVFRDNVRSQCFSLEIMQDVSNGSKHYEITMYEPPTKNAVIDLGSNIPFDMNQNLGDAYLKVVSKDGKEYDFIEEVKKCIDFWEEFLKKLD